MYTYTSLIQQYIKLVNKKNFIRINLKNESSIDLKQSINEKFKKHSILKTFYIKNIRRIKKNMFIKNILSNVDIYTK